MSKVVVIGCRLPCGIVLELTNPAGANVKVTLNGQNSTQEGREIILLSKRDYGVTYVDSDFWEAWKLQYAGFAPLETNAIFEAKDEREAKAIHKEVQDEPTGHEPMPQITDNVKPAD